MNKIDDAMNSLSDGINKEDIFAESFIINDNFSEFDSSLYFNGSDLNYNVSNSTIYTEDWRNAYKPILDLLLLIILVVVMLSMGCEITWKNLGGYCGILIMFVCIGMEILLFPNMFSEVPAKLYIAILSLPTIGLTLGYGLAFLLKRDIPVRRTIAIECGVQNVPLALTIVALSFPIEMQEDIILLPWLYGFSMMSGCTVICLIYHFYLKKSLQNNAQEDLDIDLKEAPLLEDTPNGSSNIKIVIKQSNPQNGKFLETDHTTC